VLIWVEAFFYLIIGLLFVDAQRDNMGQRHRRFIIAVAFLLWPVFLVLKLLYKFFEWV
jgi:uncharacterized membrane protein YozB (DUF420 family)